MLALPPRNLLNFSVGIVFCFLHVSCSDEDEKLIAEKEVPEAVIEAFVKSYPSGVVREYAEETKDGRRVYEVSFEMSGRKIDVMYDANGSTVEVEEEIAAEALPGIVQSSIKAEFPRFSIKKAESLERQGQRYYEARIMDMDDNREYELVFSGEGKLIEKEESVEKEE